MLLKRSVSIINSRNQLKYRENNNLFQYFYNNQQISRLFWGKSDDKDDNKSLPEVIVIEDKSKSLSIPLFGDNSPQTNPLITLPITRKPVFPNFISSVLIKDENTINSLNKHFETSMNSASPAYIGVFLRNQLNSDNNNPIVSNYPELITSMSELHSVGTFAQITSIIKSESGGIDTGAQVLLMGHRRITLKDIESYGPPIMSNVYHWKRTVLPLDKQSNAIKAYSNEVITAIRELLKLNPLAQEHLQQYIPRIEISDPYRLADFAAAMTTADPQELQRVLACKDPEERLSIVLELLIKEKELAKLQREISKQVEEKMSKQQREYLLREQLKSIKNELGIEKDDKDELLEKFYIKLKALNDLTFNNKTEILKIINDELVKLKNLEKNSPEFNVTRAYLDWLFVIPHGKFSNDRLNISIARNILDSDHYGLDDIKKRILEFIAVGKLQGSVAGKIICFIGPPGVGKTSIAKSIATALNRQFYRFSVGGLTDIAEIKGHRRTYIGAMPGKPLQCLKTSGYMNPLILIDEIDKLGRGYSGDPASALLELLDPNQNSSFVDHYLDVPIDFSNVLFVCTANDESTIPGPLKDRMEIIRLSGYDIPEKVAIALKYLTPKAIKESGIKKVSGFSIEFTEEALETLVKNYCRESGVRSLEKHIEKIVRKIVYNVVHELEQKERNEAELSDITTGIPDSTLLDASLLPSDLPKESPKTNIDMSLEKTITVTSKNLEEYIGKPKYAQDTIYDSDQDVPLPVGVVMGLAWNPLGGSPVFVETAALATQYSETGGSVNIITGQLGNVMKESVNIAYTFARKFIEEKFPDNKFFKSHTLHVHVPEGAVEKDGPSAGVTMATSLISIATGRSLRPRLAMTGELSLTGKVLPVGGIKEKTLAARRSGANTVIIPNGNKRDYEELPQYVKDCVHFHFANSYEDVYKIAFSED